MQSDNRVYYKYDKICFEAVDEYIRKMRMTGLITLRGNGRFLDINTFENETIDYIIKNYTDYKKFDNEDDYIDYMGSIDENILQIKENIKIDTLDIKIKTLHKYASEKTKDQIIKELNYVCNKKESQDDVLKYIDAPARLEFLVSIALVQNFNDLDVKPNYIVDDEGLPTCTASGGNADIECFEENYISLVEVTLMCGRSDQVNNEIIPISRHLRDVKEKNNTSIVFSILIAPIIHEDTIEAADWQYYKNKVDIIPLNIDNFVSCIEKVDKIKEIISFYD